MSEATKKTFDHYTNVPGGGYRCIDWDKEDITIYGNIKQANLWGVLSMTLLPCQTILPGTIGWTEDDVREDCIADE